MQPVKLKSKHRSFCFSVKGHVKMLRLALTVTSMTFFILAQAPEPYIVITGFEVTVIFFFIILYMLRLDRVIDCLFWPLLEIPGGSVNNGLKRNKTRGYYQLTGNSGIHDSHICVGTDARNYNIYSPWRDVWTPGGSVLYCRRGPYLPEASIQSKWSLSENCCS
ncbi:uncharacterized protein [Equus asinus]|uniref:Uncharacterized protein n=1 Tax=Equus asinus TaxID=9793 RepID=A0A9L0KAB8_EQUAS